VGAKVEVEAPLPTVGDVVVVAVVVDDGVAASLVWKSTAGAGSMTWSSTTDTPAHATPTAAMLPASHNTNNPIFFMTSVSRFPSPNLVKPTLNDP
jgi:hypothetical protein